VFNLPRGGKRQGTPGKGYSNRTDLQTDYNNAETSAASGGERQPLPQQQPNQMFPEDSPMLLDPTNRPDSPITGGLSSGPGVGPEVMDPRLEETRQLKRWLPIIEPMLNQEDTPNSVRALVRYIKGT